MYFQCQHPIHRLLVISKTLTCVGGPTTPLMIFDWKRNQFTTPSGHSGTGPSFDHTFGEGKGGFYLYMEASAPRAVNDTARLFSPVFPSDYSGGCFVFWYHMYGSTTAFVTAVQLQNEE
ncbi:hypothetical protein CEXT_576061 [Caerostris extrusa]|uniref:MAM domain-containing protein n=1 Tax=Caerostris extrusa TaxID=172846 RepID=A0AAV4SHV2_CAEEX|nr:hypothetical protein CEXT_576061 [Caerostris extrusa]